MVIIDGKEKTINAIWVEKYHRLPSDPCSIYQKNNV